MRPASAPSIDHKLIKLKRLAYIVAIKSRVDLVESNSDKDLGKE